MQTAEQVIDIIRKLPVGERERFFVQLDMERKSPPDDDKIRSGWKSIMALSGCVDLGECIISNPDREWFYQERIDDLS